MAPGGGFAISLEARWNGEEHAEQLTKVNNTEFLEIQYKELNKATI